MKKKLFFFLLSTTIYIYAYSQLENQQVIQVPTTAQGNLTNAALYLPPDYDSIKKFPLIIYLHGTGGAGTDITKLIEGGVSLCGRINDGTWIPQATNPKDGKQYEFIVFCPQAPEWSYQYIHLKYMLPVLLKKYNIDTTRIYITGISAGGYGAWTCVSDDTSFVKKIAAIVPVSAVTVETYREPKIKQNVKQFSLPIWDICGTADAWYTQALRYDTLINNANPPIPEKLTGILNGGHTVAGSAYDTTWKINNMNVFEWMLQYSRGNSAQVNPVAIIDGNANEIISLPQNSTQLNGKNSYDVNGYLIKYKWSKLSGPNQFTLTNTDNAIALFSNLTKGKYIVKLTVTDNKGASASDIKTVTVDSFAQGSCNGGKIYIVKGSDNGKYINGASFSYSPGDTLVLKSSDNPFSYFSLESIHGTATCPVTIINEGGQVNLQSGMAFNNCTYLKLTGMGSRDQYGFHIEDPASQGVAIDVYGRSKNIEINNVYIHNKTYGFWIKQEASCDDSLQYPNWIIDSIFIHDNLLRKTNQEGMYLGSTDPNGTRVISCNGKNIYPKPFRLGDIHVYNNIIDSTNRSGIQLSCASFGNNVINNNKVSNCGYEFNSWQGNGISLGGYTHAHVRYNDINNTYAMGIFVLGSGEIHIRHNKINNSGHLGDHTANGMASIMVDTRPTSPADSSLLIVEGNVLGTNTDSNIRFYKTYDTYAKGNLICDNTNQSGNTASISVASGINWSDCSGKMKNNIEQKPLLAKDQPKNQFKNESIILYPNPASDVLNVQLNNTMAGKLALNIYDAQQRLIQSKNIYNSSSSTEAINVSNLRPGFYFLQIISAHEKSMLKFIKEK
ncbi:MAG: PKD domain-containing protein [Chitinophagaceae bacterium]